METIQELRRLLQEEKIHPSGWKRPWGYKTFQRGPSIYITRVLAQTRITPTQVTVAGILIGLVGCWSLLNGNWMYELFGISLLYLNILSDKVDGELARYKRVYSLKGIFWDEINHVIIPPLFWLSLAWGISEISIFYDKRYLMIVAAIGACSLMLNRIVHSLAAQIFTKKYLKQKDNLSVRQKMHDVIAEKTSWIFLRRAMRILYQLQDFFIILMVIAIAIVAEHVLRRDAIFHPYTAYAVILGSGLFFFFALSNTIRKARAVESDIAALSAAHPIQDQ